MVLTDVARVGVSWWLVKLGLKTPNVHLKTPQPSPQEPRTFTPMKTVFRSTEQFFRDDAAPAAGKFQLFLRCSN